MSGQFERFEQENDRDGKYRWRYRCIENDKVMFGSTEGYHNASERDHCLLQAMLTTTDTRIVDIPAPLNRLGLLGGSAVPPINQLGLLGVSPAVNALMSPAAAYGMGLKMPGQKK